MAQAPRDENRITTLLGTSNADGVTPVVIWADPVTHRLLVDIPGGTGTVTSVSVVTANGFAGTVATATTTPAITLSTTVTGILKGNGTAISAATPGTDYTALAFKTIAVSGQSDVVADAPEDTLTLVGSGITITTNAATDTVTFTAAAASLVIGTTTISSGTTTRILYDNAGVLGEYTISGSGTVVAMANSPVLITPTLGVATATSINGLTISTTTGTLTITNAKTLAVTNSITIAGTDGKTLTVSNSLTLAGTDGTVMTFPTTSKTIAANDGTNWTFASQAIGDIVYASSTTAFTRLAAVAAGQVLVSAGTGTAPAYSANPNVTTIELGAAATDTTLSRAAAGDLAVEGVSVATTSNTKTLTNKRITRRLTTTNAPGATPTTNSDNVDIMNFTGLSTAITSMSTNLSGTPVDGDLLEFRFTDDGTARGITWGATFAATTIALPTTTVISTMLRVGFEYSGSTWKCIATA